MNVNFDDMLSKPDNLFAVLGTKLSKNDNVCYKAYCVYSIKTKETKYCYSAYYPIQGNPVEFNSFKSLSKAWEKV